MRKEKLEELKSLVEQLKVVDFEKTNIIDDTALNNKQEEMNVHMKYPIY